MTIHSDSFTVHADYVPTGLSELQFFIAIVLTCGVLITCAVLYLRILDKRSSRGPKPHAYKVAAAFSTIVVGILLGTYILLTGGVKSSPDIGTIIAAPEDCAISSGTGIKSSDTIVAVSELPEGQKRATFHVNAACKDAESLQQLLELDESLIPLDRQPVHAGVDS